MRFISTFIFIVAALAGFGQLPQIKLVEFATGLSKPVDVKHSHDNRLFVVERSGKIKIVRPSGAVDAVPFMDITNKVNSTGGEQGLLSMAFSPTFKKDGYFFVNYTKGTGPGVSVIARYSVSALDSNVADTATELIIFQLTQPYDNHNGCDLRFGPDGYLYASFGDGGSANDPQGNAQNMNTLLGKIIRIDPFSGSTYAIPPSNPFVSASNVLPEIWAYGLRNPWRCSFDRITGDYWIADVGQNLIEEVNFQPASSSGGENYGWRCYEGTSSFNPQGCSTVQTMYTMPAFEYNQSGQNGCSVTGGYVYRGGKFKNMFGKYFNTDFCSGRIWCTERSGNTFTTNVLNNYFQFQFSSFGEDHEGELYLTTLSSGKVYRLIDTSNCTPVSFLGFSDTLKVCGTVKLSTPAHSDLSYAWYFNNGAIQNATTSVLTGTQTGWHKVVVTNSANCTSSDSVYTELKPAVSLTLSGIHPTYCLEAPIDTILTSHPGGTITVNGILSANLFYPAAIGVGVHTIKHQLNNTSGCVSETALTVTVTACAGINENETATAFRLVPNPADADVTLQWYGLKQSDLSIGIYDLQGRLVLTKKLVSETGQQLIKLSLSDLPNGVYFVKCHHSTQEVHLKLVVAH